MRVSYLSIFWSCLSPISFSWFPQHVSLPTLCLLLSYFFFYNPLSPISVAHMLTGAGHPLEHGQLTKAPLRKKNDSPFPGSRQLPRVEPVSLPSSRKPPTPVHAGTLTGLILSVQVTSTAVNSGLAKAMSCPCPEGSISQHFSPASSSYILSAPSPMMFPEPRNGGLI